MTSKEKETSSEAKCEATMADPILTKIQSLYLSKTHSDCTFTVGKVSFPAHSFLIRLQSPTLYELIQGSKSKDAVITDVSSRVFLVMLRFCYFGNVSKESDEEEKSDLFDEVLAASQKYQMESLSAVCEARLYDSLITFDDLPKSIISATSMTNQKEWASRLGALSGGLSKSKQWLNASEFIVGLLASSDTVCVSEYDLFKACLEWAKVECNRQKLDDSKADGLKKVLKNILPLIRFPLMSQSELAVVSSSSLLDSLIMLQLFQYCVDPKAKASFTFNMEPRSGGLFLFDSKNTPSYNSEVKLDFTNKGRTIIIKSTGQEGGVSLDREAIKKRFGIDDLKSISISFNAKFTSGDSAYGVGRHGGFFYGASTGRALKNNIVDWIDRSSDHGFRIYTNGDSTIQSYGTSLDDPDLHWKIVVDASGKKASFITNGQTLKEDYPIARTENPIFGFWVYASSTLEVSDFRIHRS
eukprot:TRINITY_DN7703_c0_g1_i1.p1 TRINITY_DN7703_c0_g1~~TRINITY_DN7703_c0_g1_i1.p1  ORF type:complete len:469 (-),score=69.48 TRINITY_DN7703_c0_g1_i1:176-1582(-)